MCIYDNNNLVPFRMLRLFMWHGREKTLDNVIQGCTKFPKCRRCLKILDTSWVTWRKFHTEDPPILRHCCTKYSPPFDLPPMICATLLLLKTTFKHNSMYLMLEVQRTETDRRRSASENRFFSDGTELCWIFCSQMEVAAAPHMVESGPVLLTTLCYEHIIILPNRICHMGV
jgi:hypothetical protein